MITGKDYLDAISVVNEEWGEEVVKAAWVIKKTPMTFNEFLNHCIACGGNLGGMLLSGVHKLYPVVWDAIPEHMGIHAFTTICNLLILLGIDVSEE